MSNSLLPPGVWQSLQLKWLWVYHGDVPGTDSWSAVITVPAGWFWVERGLAKVETDGRVTIIKPGQSFFSAPGVRRQWFAAGTRLLSVGLRCLTPGGLPLYNEGLNIAIARPGSAALLKATRILFGTIHGRKRLVPFRDAIVPTARTLSNWCLREAAFNEWFRVYLSALDRLGIQPAATSRETELRLERLLSALNEWPLQHPLHLATLAAASGLGERRARDLLRTHLGMTPQAWIERRRLDGAQTSLREGTLRIKEIAYLLGFRHAPHFTTWFKRATHVTPTAFRATHIASEPV